MGDMGDLYRALKEEKKARKQSLFERNIEKIINLNLPYTKLTEYQYKIYSINFYPSTDKWYYDKEKVSGRGLVSLINYAKTKGLIQL